MQTQPTRSGRHDDGMSLIEVMAALVIFGILSTGIVAGMVTISRMTADNEARVVAAGLAAQDIALARAIGDPFKLFERGDVTTTALVGGRTYTTKRTVRLVSQSGVDVACNTSSDLFYARLNVRVSWSNKLTTTNDVQDDTVVAPEGRINDSATGSVSVFVVGADGLPESGVNVALTPTQGGAALASTVPATDSSGCTRAGAVTPGTYTVTVTKSGYKDTLQRSAPTKTVVVTAGTNQALSFQYDLTATYGTSYTPWPVNYTSTTPLLPTNLDTTFVNATAGRYTIATPVTSVTLHPFSAGYAAIAGTPSDDTGAAVCAANDPVAWAASSSNGPSRLTGVRGTGAASAGGRTDFSTTSGTTSRTGIPMGVVLISSPQRVNSATLTATTATPIPGGTASPGCTTTTTYRYDTVGPVTQVALLLPYGSYTINVDSAELRGQVQAQYLSVPTNVGGGGVQSNGVVTLDPRPAR